MALAAGIGTLTLPAPLGLRPVPESRIVLVDARVTDPGEHVLLERSAVLRSSVKDLTVHDLPAGHLYLHLDIDVADPSDVPDLLYPAPGGPALPDLLSAVSRVTATGRVAAIGIAATWRPSRRRPPGPAPPPARRGRTSPPSQLTDTAATSGMSVELDVTGVRRRSNPRGVDFAC
jgi:arginase